MWYHHMLRTVANLLIIVAVGIVLYFLVANAYTEGTANVIGLGYFLLTIRFFDLLETVEDAMAPTSDL